MASHWFPIPRGASAAGAATTALAVAACSSGFGVLPCGEIAAGGCPVGRGGTCDDPVCEALYDCVQGNWVLAVTCPSGPGGSGAAGAGVAGGGGAGGACATATIDHTGETTGCLPGLQAPDCPAAAAESCAPCSTGCSDFYLCKTDGWQLAAYCYDGQLVVN